MTTLADISKRCGVSTATVSYVLNGKGDEHRISTIMQQKILSTARELGYSKVVSKKTQIIPTVEIYWPTSILTMSTPTLIEALNKAVSMESGKVELNVKFYDPGHINTQSSIWTHRPRTAALLVSTVKEDIEYLNENPACIPIVLLNRTSDRYCYSTVDQEEAGALAANHAFKKGGHDICLISTITTFTGFKFREKAIIRALNRLGVQMADKVLFSSGNVDDGYEVGLRLARAKHHPKVILCTYDTVAMGICSAFYESGLMIGKDVELITTSVGPPRILARTSPPLTVVDIKFGETSERGIKLAIDLALGRISEHTGIVVHPEIIYRQSSPIGDYY